MLKPMTEWTEDELHHAVDTAPHFRKDETINMAVWIGCAARDELARRRETKEQS